MTIKYLAVLDFEATCFEDSDDHEIIEFPTVIIDIETKKVIDEFRVYIKPIKNSKLSDFCKNLTGITQEQVNSGISLEEAIKMHGKFMSQYQDSFFVICAMFLQSSKPE